MAIFESFLLGNLSQKVANLVMYKARGKGIVRGKPLKIKNPRTAEQLTQRAKMKLLVDLSRRFGPVITIGFASHAGKQSVYNAFVSANMPQVTVDENFEADIDFSKILCSVGGIDIPDVTASLPEDGNKILLAFEAQEATGTAAADDCVYAGFYETVQKSARLLKIGERRTSANTEFVLPKKWIAANVRIYAFAVSKSKRNASATLYVELS